MQNSNSHQQDHEGNRKQRACMTNTRQVQRSSLCTMYTCLCTDMYKLAIGKEGTSNLTHHVFIIIDVQIDSSIREYMTDQPRQVFV